KGIAQRSGHPGLAFRGMINLLRERHHEDKQAKKNAIYYSAVIRVVIKKLVRSKDCAGREIEAEDPDNGAPILTKGNPRMGGEGELPKERTQSKMAKALRCVGRGHTLRDLSPNAEMSREGYDHAVNCLENTKVLKQVVESGEEATMSPVGLGYPKAKRRLERKWTQRSVIMPKRRIYRWQERNTDARQRIVGPWAWQGHGLGSAMVPQRRDFRGGIDPLLSWRESVGRKRGRGGGESRGKLQVPRQGRRAEAKELHKTGVNGLLIKISENEGLRVDAGVLD
ncbi:hypothetical protein B296_00058233, partial [Ensete ventricosum]